MADSITDRLLVMNDLIKGISQGKFYIEDFYKDNGNPKVIGQGNFTQEKYDRFFSERENLLTQYKEGMDYIVSSGKEGQGYTEEHKTFATNVSKSIETENQNDTIITVRFTTLPSKTQDKGSDEPKSPRGE
jgi:hypothetical protein